MRDHEPSNWPGSLGTVQAGLNRQMPRMVDYGLAGVLFAVPLFMGGRRPLGQLVLVSIIAVTAVLWFALQLSGKTTRRWTWSGAEVICAGALLLVVLQLVPLSPSSVARLSPHTKELLPLWTQTADWPAWHQVSLAPAETRGGLSLLVAYVLLFVVASQHLRQLSQIERLLKGIALAGIGMGIIGLAQYLVGNGKFLWVYEHPSRDTLYAVKGTFANQNHFAHFLALSLGPIIWWLRGARIGDSVKEGFHFGKRADTLPLARILLVIVLGVMMLAGLLTYSRGGILVMLLAAITCMAIFAAKRMVGKQAAVATVGIAIVIFGAVWIHGHDLLLRKMETIRTAELDTLDESRGRRKIWLAVCKAIPDFSLLGSGIGSHRELAPTYLAEDSDVGYTHAESGYLQVLLEAGTPGFVLLLSGIGLSGYWLVRVVQSSGEPRFVAVAAAIAAGWMASVVHAFVDFAWYLPACMSVTILLLAAAMRLYQLSLGDKALRHEVPLSRFSWTIAAVTALFLASTTVHERVAPALAAPYWDEYLGWSLAANHFGTKTVGRGRQRRLGEVDRSSPEAVARMTDLVHQVLVRNPYHARAHLRMAALCLRQFGAQQQNAENVMTLDQIRDAAIASNFPSQDALRDWLAKVVGENDVYLDRALYHTKAGLRLCPLQGRGYVYLNEVAFLSSSPLPSEDRLLEQAYAVRPHTASVQFVLGRHRMLSGETPEALDLWKQAFRSGIEIRERIIRALGSQLTAAEWEELFHPDVDGWAQLFEYFRKSQQDERLRQVGQKYTQLADAKARTLTGEAAADLWFKIQFAHHVMGNAAGAAAAAGQAVEADARNYEFHYVYALRAYQAGHFEQALEQFRWCQSRRPDDPKLSRLVDSVRRSIHQVEATRPVAAHAARR